MLLLSAPLLAPTQVTYGRMPSRLYPFCGLSLGIAGRDAPVRWDGAFMRANKVILKHMPYWSNAEIEIDAVKSAKMNRRRLSPKNLMKLQINATCKYEREARRMQRAGVTDPRYLPAHEEAASARDTLGACCRGKRQSPTCSTPRVTARRDDTHTGQLWRTKSSHRTPTIRRRNSCSPTCWKLLLCFF